MDRHHPRLVETDFPASRNKLMSHDQYHCPGSICVGDDTPNWKENVIWYPGEFVCTRKPYAHVQKVQHRINKLLLKGVFKNPKRWFTYKTLDVILSVRPGKKGGNPERDTDVDRAAERAQRRKTSRNNRVSKEKTQKRTTYTSHA